MSGTGWPSHDEVREAAEKLQRHFHVFPPPDDEILTPFGEDVVALLAALASPAPAAAPDEVERAVAKYVRAKLAVAACNCPGTHTCQHEADAEQAEVQLADVTLGARAARGGGA